jgi:hypothetical protein
MLPGCDLIECVCSFEFAMLIVCFVECPWWCKTPSFIALCCISALN